MTTFFVPGVPAPQGSKRLVRTSVGRTLMIDANSEALKVWRNTVTMTAFSHRLAFGKREPLGVELGFVMPATIKERSGWCSVRPDLDKLCRAVLDGLTDAGALEDDSQVARLVATKTRGIHCGVQVSIARLSALLEDEGGPQ